MRVAGWIVTGFACLPALAQANGWPVEPPSINVNGEALVQVKPDQVVIRFGIETQDESIEIAKEKNAATMRDAVAALRDTGVPATAIQTDYLSIEPVWRDKYKEKDPVRYYLVRNSIVVTLSEVAKVDAVVTRALQTGVNHVHGIDFRTTELRKHRDRARDLALRAAREKAERMAAALGVSVGAPLQIREGYADPWWRSSAAGSMSSNVTESAPASEASDETVPLGMIAIRARVSVQFAIEGSARPVSAGS